MRSTEYSSVNPANGNVTWEGPLSLEKGNHSGMPSRTEAYLPGDERGHVNASSLGGSNTSSNVVAQHHDLNHGGYLSVENGERNALKAGASINSEKIAFVDSQPGDRPSAFMVNDTVTYPDGHSESIHNSFTNESNADQARWNDISSSLPGTYDAPNPGDGLRDSMSSEEYANLMEETDAALLNLDEEYAPSEFSVSSYDCSVNESDNSNSISDEGVGDDGIDDGLDDNEGVDDGMDI